MLRTFHINDLDISESSSHNRVLLTIKNGSGTVLLSKEEFAELCLLGQDTTYSVGDTNAVKFREEEDKQNAQNEQNIMAFPYNYDSLIHE